MVRDKTEKTPTETRQDFSQWVSVSSSVKESLVERYFLSVNFN